MQSSRSTAESTSVCLLGLIGRPFAGRVWTAASESLLVGQMRIAGGYLENELLPIPSALECDYFGPSKELYPSTRDGWPAWLPSSLEQGVGVQRRSRWLMAAVSADDRLKRAARMRSDGGSGQVEVSPDDLLEIVNSQMSALQYFKKPKVGVWRCGTRDARASSTDTSPRVVFLCPDGVRTKRMTSAQASKESSSSQICELETAGEDMFRLLCLSSVQ